MVQPALQPDLDRGRLIAAALRLLAPLAAALLLVTPFAQAQETVPGAEWQLVPPAKSGWSEAGLKETWEWSEQIHSTAVMVVHHGTLVAAWGDTEKRTELASVRKSFLSALIGIAVADHKIALDKTMAELGIDDNPPSLTAEEKQATVRMLLQARSGIYHPALYETMGMAAKRPERGSHPPGTFWYYNNWDFNALGTIYEQATHTGIYDALDRLIAKPIGMQDYRPADGTYYTGHDSIHRAYPIRMSARDLARFGLLYLHKGAWAGHQLVPADWVRESMQPYSDTARTGIPMGYGYLWWTASSSEPSGILGPGWFSARGAGGQFALVSPTYDLVIVSRVDRDQRLPDPGFAKIMQLVELVMKAGGLVH